MDPRDTEHVKQFDLALETWTDTRFITREELRAAAMFVLYLVNLAEHDGWVYNGHSWKEASPMGCLVVKATIEGTPYVVFTSARTTISSMKVFLRKLEGGMLEWVPDKYRA